jgi:phosphoglycolate phosphatase-like HAD superfamily hydrolase
MRHELERGEKKPCFVFDLDKTLADDEHRVHFLSNERDWKSYYENCDKDEPIQATCAIANSLSSLYSILIVTGRSEVVEEKTHAWLRKHVPGYKAIFMRGAKDYRPNAEIKLEHMRAIEKLWGYKVLMVFDDQPQVCDALRAAGYLVAQIADGHKDFMEYPIKPEVRSGPVR